MTTSHEVDARLAASEIEEAALPVRELVRAIRNVVLGDLQEPVVLVLPHRHVRIEPLAVLERDERLDLLLGLARPAV